MRNRKMMNTLRNKKGNSKQKRLKSQDIKIRISNLKSLEIRKMPFKKNYRNSEQKINNKTDKLDC